MQNGKNIKLLSPALIISKFFLQYTNFIQNRKIPHLKDFKSLYIHREKVLT